MDLGVACGVVAASGATTGFSTFVYVHVIVCLLARAAAPVRDFGMETVPTAPVPVVTTAPVPSTQEYVVV